MVFDLAGIAILIIFGLIGYFNGFWAQFLRLLAFILSLSLAPPISKLFLPSIAAKEEIPYLAAQVISFAIAFSILYLIFSIVVVLFLRVLRKRKKNDLKLDSTFGAGFGVLKAAIGIFVLASGILSIEDTKNVAKTLEPLGWKTSTSRKIAARYALFGKMEIPLVGDIKTLKKLSHDPKLQKKIAHDPAIQALLKHPKIKVLLKDPELRKKAKAGDVMSILADKRVNQVLADPQIRALIKKIDIKKLDQKKLKKKI